MATAEMLALQEALTGRYLVERQLGRGGMGIVFLARDLALERLVAVKLLPPGLAAVPDLRERFLREARTAASLSHPNIVPIYAVEAQDGLVYYAMGYVDGETLAERVQRVGPLPPAEVGRVLQEAAWALSYAHGRGVVHRDVKPENILLERATGRALLVDFGIARSRAASPLTATGESLGTPQYMSPEQAAGEPLDGRSDLYALGAVGFYVLTGRPPFDGPTVQAILAMHLTRPAPPVASVRPGIPPKLAAAVDRCLTKEPGERFATGEALVAALQSAQMPAAAVAPEVRSFQRAAELTVVQVFTLALMLLALSELRFPTGGKILLILALYVALVITQLATRARALLRQGFGYEDVRAVFAAEARDRAALAAPRSEAEPVMSTPLRLFIGAGAVSAVIGLALGMPSTHGSLRNHLGWAFLWLGMGLIVVGLLRVATRRIVSSERPQRVAALVWMGPFGRALFRVAGAGLAARSRAKDPPPTVSAYGQRVFALLATFPADDRARLGDTADIVTRLERVVKLEGEREHELERAVLEAASGVDGLGAEGLPGTAPPSALDSQQAQLVTDLRDAQQLASVRRATAFAALESIRLELLRLRSGLGTADQAQGALRAARAVLAS